MGACFLNKIHGFIEIQQNIYIGWFTVLAFLTHQGIPCYLHDAGLENLIEVVTAPRPIVADIFSSIRIFFKFFKMFFSHKL